MKKPFFLVIFLTILMVLGSQLRWSFGPVPIVLTTIPLYYSILILPYYFSGIVPLLFLTLGAIGLPVFSKGGGLLETLSGPTGGYLVGFVLVGWLAPLSRLLPKQTRSICPPLWLAFLILHPSGLIWMYIAHNDVWFSLFPNYIWLLLADLIKITIVWFFYKYVNAPNQKLPVSSKP